jgi:hypothetical protein
VIERSSDLEISCKGTIPFGLKVRKGHEGYRRSFCDGEVMSIVGP